MKPVRILLFICFLAVAFLLSLYFEEMLFFFVESLGTGWVFSSIFIRLLVIILFVLGLRELFSVFRATRKLKLWVIALIGLVPGFFISFALAPIYTTDYGDFNDGFTMGDREKLIEATGTTYGIPPHYNVMAFFTTTCPHCKQACRKLAANNTDGSNVSVDIFFPGTKEDALRFLEENDGSEFDYHLIDDDPLFTEFGGYTFPSIFLVDAGGKTLYHWIGDEMNYNALDYLQSLN